MHGAADQFRPHKMIGDKSDHQAGKDDDDSSSECAISEQHKRSEADRDRRGRGFISPWGRIADIPAGYAGGSQSLVGNCPYFGPCGAGFGRRSLVAIFQFPFRRGGDRFDCRQRPVRRGPLGSQADAGTKSTASVDSLADIRCVS